MSSERTRVVQIVQHTSLGGATLLAMLLAQRLDPSRYEVVLATGPHAGPEGSLKEEMEAHGLRLHTIEDMVRLPSPRQDLRAIRQLRELFRDFKPHIVHTHGAKAKLLVPWATDKAPVPVKVAHIHVWEWHAAESGFERTIYIAASRLRINSYQAIVTTSDALRRQGLEKRVGRPDQYAVIKPAIELQAFAPATAEQRAAIRRELGVAPEDFCVISVSRLSKQKGPADMVQAAELMLAQRPNTQFLIVGSGPLADEIRDLIEARGLQARVRLLGIRRDIPRLLHAGDVFALSSHWEPLGMVYLEAAASGLAAVGTDVDGACEAVLNGCTGLLVPPRQPRQLAEALLKLADDADLRQKLGAEGRRHAQTFSEENFVERVSALYDRLLLVHGKG